MSAPNVRDDHRVAIVAVMTRHSPTGRLVLVVTLVAAVATAALVAPLSFAADNAPATPAATVTAGPALTADELATVLGALVWKLDVAFPQGATDANVGLSLRDNAIGSEQGFGTGVDSALRADTPRQLLVAVVPTGGGDGLHNAESVRVTIVGIGVTASTTTWNPFKGMAIGKPQTPEDLGGGRFALVGGYTGNNVSSPISRADRVLVLKIDSPTAKR